MNISTENITVIILAGGKSSRMKTDKGLIDISGRTLVQHVIDNTASITANQMIISNRYEYQKFGLPVFSDIIADKGPAAGVATGLQNSTTDLNLISTCDSPYINNDLYFEMLDHLEDHDVIVPRYNKRLYPLTAVYRRSCYKTIMTCINANDLSMKSILSFLNTKILNIEKGSALDNPRNFLNINTVSDLKELQHDGQH
ncbi:MAG: molybdenum cofactor guanylyltransferase [Bacteroidia bacterium]|nr:molybdenum cofactor guanylyltransferase [Bacteroidia bacterium]